MLFLVVLLWRRSGERLVVEMGVCVGVSVRVRGDRKDRGNGVELRTRRGVLPGDPLRRL